MIGQKTPELIHGGDIYTSLLEHDIKLLDFSSNISPLGLPAEVADAVVKHINSFDVYPDPLCRELRGALALHHAIEPNRIVCGNGSADLIYRSVQGRRPKRALVIAPGFHEYEKALCEAGTIIETYDLAYPDFCVHDDILERITQDTDMLFLCNPNNPTGVTVARKLIEAILGRCESCDTLVVIDECFNEFLDSPPEFSAVGLLKNFPQLIILKAFTKIYAMAGFRLGYILCGSETTAAQIAGIGQPWSVSTTAQIAGLQALRETEYVEELRTLIQVERSRLKEELKAVGAEVLTGDANYIFFRLAQGEGLNKDFASHMRMQGVLVRDCSNYRGLDSRYFRIAVRTVEENNTFIQAFRKVHKQGISREREE